MPTGTGKTITLLSLVTSYQLAHPEVGKLVYCTRTVPEMEKVLVELGELIAYRARYFDGRAAGEVGGSAPPILALGLSSRKNLCVNPAVSGDGTREGADAKCRRLTASWVREKAAGAGVQPGGRVSAATAAVAAAADAPTPMVIEDGGAGDGGDGDERPHLLGMYERLHERGQQGSA
jgi:DNA excision repair protein ERCC-2